MPEPSASAELPVLPIRIGLGAGATFSGFIALIAIVVASDRPVSVLVGGAFFGLFWGGAMWVSMRRLQARQLDRLHPASTPDGSGARRALRRGLLTAGVVALVEAVVVLGFCLLWGWELVFLLPGGLLGAAVWVSLDLRDLRRWQARHGLVVFTRAGARHFAWTSRQARDGLVVVPADEVDASTVYA